MYFTKLTIISAVAGIMMVTPTKAQTSKAELRAHLELASGNYCNYPTPSGNVTPAPAGYEDALAVWLEFGENVGELIKAVLFTYAPEAIIIGGGIASAFSLFETAMRKKLESFPYPENVAATRILPSTLPNAAMLGASILH